MTPNAQYLLQILEKIGSPLMRAVIAQDSSADDSALQEQAKTLAALLSRTVQVSIGMSQSFDFAKNETAIGSEQDGDTLRVALAALAGPLVADQYSKMGRLPADQDLNRLTSTLDSVLTFSENFSPNTTDAAARLQNIDSNAGAATDATQRSLHYIGAFLPVIDAVARFSFGQNEKKLVLDVSEKLVKRAMDLRETAFATIQGEEAQKAAEVKILAALGQVYAACHDAQIAAMTAGDGAAADADPDAALQTVWKNFETRCAMIEAVVGGFDMGAAATQSGAVAPEAPPATPAAPLPSDIPSETPTAPVENTTPTEQKPAIFGGAPAEPENASEPAPETPPPAAPEAPAENAESGGNPMAMFAKPKADPAPEAPPETPSEPPSADIPPAPPEAPQAPAEPPPSAPVTPSESSGDQSGGGGPMSFFKKPDDGGEGA